ncbi:MAG TPA: type IX secretion system outer membrane channel protein PorV [Cyclobacteriaceae bacterium]
MKLSIAPLLWLLLIVTPSVNAQGNPPPDGDPITDPGQLLGQTKAITTAVPFLLISPDARHAALGETGVASSPDANSAYWNPAKLVFIPTDFGGSLSYTPWLGKIINDMSISYLTGFYKITQEQAVSLGLKYFDLGDIFFTDDGRDGWNYNPREFAIELTYSRKLTEQLSVGLTGKYVHSNLTGAYSSQGLDARPGKSVAADIGIYYTAEIQNSRGSILSLGANISNIGAKITYSDNSNKDFLPTDLRLGGAFTTALDGFNSLTFLVDFNKLLVPTIDKNQTLLRGMFSSFTDAPGGFSEEIHEITLSTGIEYWYEHAFAARIGYFLEAEDKGNRKYLTLGAGFRRKSFGFDVAYLVPTNKREHPLAETLRFTILFELSKSTSQQQSVTD